MSDSDDESASGSAESDDDSSELDSDDDEQAERRRQKRELEERAAAVSMEACVNELSNSAMVMDAAMERLGFVYADDPHWMDVRTRNIVEGQAAEVAMEASFAAERSALEADR